MTSGIETVDIEKVMVNIRADIVAMSLVDDIPDFNSFTAP
jgi:hypothetical protein